jgi:hypothetical protein
MFRSAGMQNQSRNNLPMQAKAPLEPRKEKKRKARDAAAPFSNQGRRLLSAEEERAELQLPASDVHGFPPRKKGRAWSPPVVILLAKAYVKSGAAAPRAMDN